MHLMTYKIYVTDPEGKRLRIFGHKEGDKMGPLTDHVIRETLKDALVVMKSLNEIIDQHNDKGQGVLRGCTANMQIIP